MENFKSGQFIKIPHEYMYHVFLLLQHKYLTTWEVISIWQSSDGFKVVINKETVDLSTYDTPEELQGRKLYNFYDWLFDTMFIDPKSIILSK